MKQAEDGSPAMDDNAFYRAVHDMLDRLIPAEDFIIAWRDTDESELVPLYSVGDWSAASRGEGSDPSERLTKECQGIFHNGALESRDAGPRGLGNEIGRSRVRMAVPLMADGSVRGFVAVGSGRAGSHYGHQEESLLEMTARQIVIYRTQKQTWDRVRAGLERYRVFYDSSCDASLQLTPQRGILGGNPAAMAMFRCRDERELVSYSLEALSPEFQPDGSRSVEKAQAMMQAALEKGSHFFEWTHRRADGEVFSATVLLIRVILEGQPILLATVRDVTEQIRAETALSESEERNRMLFKCAPVGIVIFNAEGRPIAANDLIKDMHRITDRNGDTEKYTLFTDPTLDENSKRRIRAGETVILERWYDFDYVRDHHVYGTTRTGRMYGRWIYAPLHSTNRRDTMLIVQDLTDYKKAEEGIRESEQRYRSLVENTPAGVFLQDKESGRLLYVNRRLCKMFGYTVEEVTETVGAKLLPEEIRARLYGPAETNVPDRLSFLARRKDGEVFDAEIILMQVAYEGRMCNQGLLRDVSEARLLQKEIIFASEREQRRIGCELHDVLGQDLSSMAVLVTALQKSLVKQGHRKAAAEAGRIGDLASEALSHARRLARGLVPMGIGREGLVRALADMASNTELILGISCRCESDPPDLMAEVDEFTALNVYRIVQEAINNAVKHGAARNVLISVWLEEGQRIRIAVCSDGIGISHPRPTTGGLGLHIMKYRANLLGGKLDVRPGETGGTIVECRFPLARRERFEIREGLYEQQSKERHRQGAGRR